jgi:hypothetical protein
VRTERVTLRHTAEGDRPVALSEPSGADEMSVEGVDTLCAVELLTRLLGEGALDPMQMAASDRDALLAALHRQCWGDRIISTLLCAACDSRFDLSFQLSEVQRHLASASAELGPFKVPSAAEELSAIAHGARGGVLQLARTCGAAPEDVERASDALAAVAPIVDLDLGARCVECGHEQAAHFDLQSFVLQRLLNERTALLAEIHLLAAAYGWSLAEILSLARSTRRAMVAVLAKASRT